MSSSSPSFKAAADYLSNASHLSKVSNNVKLELYALYKCITVSERPQTPRPGLFDFTSRAKWDAWDKLGSESGNKEGWINRYLEIARSLGWKEEGSAELHGSGSLEDTVKSEVNKKSEGDGVVIGRHVSILSAPDIPVENTLHGRVLDNDISRVVALLDADPSTNVNAKDEYGYTPLHLAADRGHKNMVAILLQKGADVSVKDGDDYTAFDLADLAGHKEISDMLL